MFTVKELQVCPKIRKLVRFKIVSLRDIPQGECFTKVSENNPKYMSIFYVDYHKSIGVSELAGHHMTMCIDMDTGESNFLLSAEQVRHYEPTEEEMLAVIPFITG